MSTTSARVSQPEDPWDAVTWEGHERLQLKRERAMSLREKIQAIEGMAEVAQRLAQFRSNNTSQK